MDLFALVSLHYALEKQRAEIEQKIESLKIQIEMNYMLQRELKKREAQDEPTDKQNNPIG